MTEFVFLTTAPWTDRVAWTLLHFLWQGALLGLAFAAIRSLLFARATPRERYDLACLTLALMAAAPLVTFWLLGSENTSALYRYIPRASAGAAEAAAAWQIAQLDSLRSAFPWIVALWLTGACAFSLRLAGGWFAAARLRFAGEVRPAPAEWQLALNRLAAHIGVSRPVRFLTSTLAHTPMAIGHLRPVVLVPLGVIAGLPADQLEAVLAHELAHIWRRDYIVNLIQCLIESLLFYHPAVWYVSNQIRNERELCCDDIAVCVCGGRAAYARALAGVELLRFSPARVAMAANGGQLLNRIRRLVEPEALTHNRPGFGGALALGALLAAGVAAATIHNPQPQRVNIHVPSAERTVEATPAPITPRRQEHRAIAIAQPVESAPEPPSEEPRREASLGDMFRRLTFSPEGRTLTSIEIRGFSDEAGNDLVRRLPVHEGDRLQVNSLERVGAVARQYGERIEYRLAANGENSAVLYIHPAGAAGGELLHRK